MAWGGRATRGRDRLRFEAHAFRRQRRDCLPLLSYLQAGGPPGGAGQLGESI